MPGGVVRVSAPAHLHAGNPDLHGGYGRLYGTLGVAITEPRLEVELEESDNYTVELSDEAVSLLDSYVYTARRYVATAERFLRVIADLAGCRGLRLKVERVIPPWVGLGGLTPLALAVASAASRLCNPIDLRDAAISLGRSTISGLGFYSFINGGLLFDGGFVVGEEHVPPLVFRADVPSDVVAVVYVSPLGLASRIVEFKEKEYEVLRKMPKMDPEFADSVSRMLLMGVLANAADGRWRDAFKWLGEFNRVLGEYWAEKQGSVYCCTEVEDAIAAMLEAGAWGAGQSSWGPTVYAFTEPNKAEEVLGAAVSLLRSKGPLLAGIARVDNRGAVIQGPRE